MVNNIKVNDIRKNLEVSFSSNPEFNAVNIGKDNTVEDKIFAYLIKISTAFKVNLDNFYERMKTFSLKPLSVYANDGFISYDPVSNIGSINPVVLEKDDNNEFNIDNLFAQIMLMVTTAKDNYYGFGNVRELNSLNDACTYIIASNITSSSQKNLLEEEVTLLNQMDVLLGAAGSRTDFINAYFSNNGTILKEEINKLGIGDDLLNEMNYLYQAKLSKLNVPEGHAKVSNKINKLFAMMVSNDMIKSDDMIEKYKSYLYNDEIFDYSNVNVSNNRERVLAALNALEEKKKINIQETGQVMKKLA